MIVQKLYDFLVIDCLHDSVAVYNVTECQMNTNLSGKVAVKTFTVRVE